MLKINKLNITLANYVITCYIIYTVRNTNEEETKMRKEKRSELMREVSFGKATARVSLEVLEYDKSGGGTAFDLETIEVINIEIISPSGEVVERSNYASAIEYHPIYAHRFEGASTNDVLTIVGSAQTKGDQAKNDIDTAIEEMRNELNEEFDLKEEIEGFSELEIAKEIVNVVKVKKIKNLKTEKELQEWRESYNDLMNEGGEGYVPINISKETYNNALKIVEETKNEME